MEHCKIWEYNLREENILVCKMSDLILKKPKSNPGGVTGSSWVLLPPFVGLDDSRNTAQLASKMMRDGCVMKITKSLGRVSSCSTIRLAS